MTCTAQFDSEAAFVYAVVGTLGGQPRIHTDTVLALMPPPPQHELFRVRDRSILMPHGVSSQV